MGGEFSGVLPRAIVLIQARENGGIAIEPVVCRVAVDCLAAFPMMALPLKLPPAVSRRIDAPRLVACRH